VEKRLWPLAVRRASGLFVRDVDYYVEILMGNSYWPLAAGGNGAISKFGIRVIARSRWGGF